MRTGAANVLVGDLVSPGADTTFRRVVTVTRTERSVALTYRGKDGDVMRNYSENAAVDIATRVKHPAGHLLYRVAPHPTRPGVAAFVLIPE